MSYKDTLREIFRGLRIRPALYKLDVKARVNFGGVGPPNYNLVPISSNRVWDQILRSGANVINDMRILELVVDPIPRENDSGYDPTPDSVPGTSRDSAYCHEPYQQNPSMENYEDSLEYNSGSGDDNSIGEDAADVIPDCVSDEEEEEENILGGGGDNHPIPAFHDVSDFERGDVDFFGQKISGPLSENRVFKCKEDLKSAVQDYHIRKNIQFHVQNSSKTKYVVKCEDSRCYWRLYAKPSGVNECWIIKTNQFPHSCHASMTRKDHRQLTAAMVAQVIADALPKNLEMKIETVRSLVRKVYPGVTPSYNKLWRGRELAISHMFGSWEESYEMLPLLLNSMQSANPNMKVCFESDPSTVPGVNIFKRVAWAFGPCIEAIPYLRPLISIDAAFLSGRYGGRLFMAVGYDANNGLVPLGFAIAEKEDQFNWGWFMSWLRSYVIGPGFRCVLSDQAGSIKCIFEKDNLGWCEEKGEAVHRYCSQHVAANLYEKCKNKNVVRLYRWTVRQTKKEKFEQGMEAIKNTSDKGYEHLLQVGTTTHNNVREPPRYDRWAQWSDGGYRFGTMTTNGSESLNSVYKVARTLPVAALVENTFYHTVE